MRRKRGTRPCAYFHVVFRSSCASRALRSTSVKTSQRPWLAWLRGCELIQRPRAPTRAGQLPVVEAEGQASRHPGRSRAGLDPRSLSFLPHHQGLGSKPPFRLVFPTHASLPVSWDRSQSPSPQSWTRRPVRLAVGSVSHGQQHSTRTRLHAAFIFTGLPRLATPTFLLRSPFPANPQSPFVFSCMCELASRSLIDFLAAFYVTFGTTFSTTAAMERA